MVASHDRLVETFEGVTTFLDLRHYLRFGALLSCDRVLRTALPVLSDLMRITGSSFVPRRTTVPPLGPLTQAVSQTLDCRPCFARECPLGHTQCLKTLEPDRVITALSRLLEQTTH